MADKTLDLSENVGVKDEVKAEVKPASSGPQYRYMDEACSGIAYYANSEITAHDQGFCNNCAATLSAFKPQNLIALTDNEKEQLAALKK